MQKVEPKKENIYFPSRLSRSQRRRRLAERGEKSAESKKNPERRDREALIKRVVGCGRQCNETCEGSREGLAFPRARKQARQQA